MLYYDSPLKLSGSSSNVGLRAAPLNIMIDSGVPMPYVGSTDQPYPTSGEWFASIVPFTIEKVS